MADQSSTIRQQAGAVKRLLINISREEKKNEPNLTLGHLVGLTQSIVDAFSPGRKIDFPDVYSLQLVDGLSQDIRAQGQSFPFVINRFKSQDLSDPSQASPTVYVLSQLYPDDVAAILRSIQGFVDTWYGQPKQIKFDWGYELTSILSQINQANDPKTLQLIATGNLKKAAEVTLEVISELHQRLTEEISTDLDEIEPIIAQIKQKFTTASTADQYQQIWEELGLEIAQSLADSPINETVIITGQNNYSANGARQVINVFYELIIEQYKQREVEKPWDLASDESKSRFNPQIRDYFTVNELQEEITSVADNKKAAAFIERIEQLFTELKQEPTPVAAGAETEDEAGGEAEETPEEKKEVNYQSIEQITALVINPLISNSGESFWEQASSLGINADNISDEQKDWFLVRLPNFIQELLTAGAKKKIEDEIQKWAKSNLESENNEGLNYIINESELQKLKELIHKQFFTDNKDFFIKKISEIPLAEELKDARPVTPDTPPGEIVTPPAEDKAAPSTERGEKIDRNKFISETTTAFLGANFGTEGEAFRKFVYDYLAKNASTELTTAGLLTERLKLFRQLQLDSHFYELSQNYYQQRLTQVGLDDALSITNLYNTIDSFLVLIDEPQKYINNLTDEQLIKQFGLEGKVTDVQALKNILLGLIFVRRAHYYVKNSTPIKGWFGENKAKDKLSNPQYLNQLRSFVSQTGEEGVMALNLDEDGINQSEVDENRKKMIKDLYRELWIKTVSGKSQEELMEVYLLYGVDVIQIDFTSLPVPQGFVYSDMVQHANLDQPTAAQAQKSGVAKNLFKEGKSQLGKLALSAVAPELAPILATLENLPIIGAQVKEIEEKAGNLLLVAGGILGAGIATLIGLLTRSVGAAIGGLTGILSGAAIGFSVGGPWGALIGGIAGGIGGGTIGYHLKNIGSWFKGLGGSSGTTGATLGLGAQAAPAAISTITPTAIVAGTIGGTAALTWMTVTSTGAALQHPLTSFSFYTVDPTTGEASPYVQIVKEAQPKKAAQPTSVTYSVSIAPQGDYSITINDVKDELKVRYNKDEYPSGTPNPDLTPKTIDDFDSLEAETTVAPGEILQFTYVVDYDMEFQHANVVNYLTLYFDYSDGTDVGSAEAMSLASVKFGNSPVFDGCWPVSGEITQLPFGGYSHRSTTPGYGSDAVDIGVPVGTPVHTAFGGQIIQAGTRGNYGTAVVVSGDDGTFIYAHLSATAVTAGSSVEAGDLLGLSGNTGASSGPHLHYERGNSSGLFYATPLSSSSVLLQLHEAIGLQVGDVVSNAQCLGE